MLPEPANERARERNGVACPGWSIDLLRLFDLLQKRCVFRTVFIANGLRSFIERGLVGGNELDASRLQLGFSVPDIGVPELALFKLCFARQLAHQILIALRKRVPGTFRKHENL